MGVFIAIVVICIIFGIIKGAINETKAPDMDSSGNMRCKRCGGANFQYWKNNDGSTTYECHNCGQRWSRY